LVLAAIVDGMELHGVPSNPHWQPAALLFDNTWSCVYSYVLLMMGGGTA